MDMGRAAGVLSDNPNRFKSWLWTQGVTGNGLTGHGQRGSVFNETHWVERSLALGVELLCPGPPGRLSALSVSLYKSVFYGVFV